MQIESIEIKNYRLFRDTKLTDIPRLCVLVGANGTGKSTLFDVFSFLKDALSMNIGKAISKRGGYRELASRGFSHEPIELALQFRLEITGKERLVTYVLKIALGKERYFVTNGGLTEHRSAFSISPRGRATRLRTRRIFPNRMRI